MRKACIATLVGKRPMTRVSRAVEKGETVGWLKVCVEAASRRIHPAVSELLPKGMESLEPLSG